MLTLEELKDKLNKEYKGFKLSNVKLDNEYVSEFTIHKTVCDDLLLYIYFWDSKYDSYISYFV